MVVSCRTRGPRCPPPRITDEGEIRCLIAAHGRWWHQIEVAPGIVTPGEDSNRAKLPLLDGLGLPANLSGVRALDIGCSDGFFAFELERRGAEVVAMDFVPETHSGFATARRILGSTVEYRMDSVYNVSPDRHGRFDLALCLGVIYHLRRPMAALDAIRSVLPPGGTLFIGTFCIDTHIQLADGTVTTLEALDPRLTAVPLWQSYPGDALNGDHTNCWAPNRRALEVALTESEFRVDAVHALPGAAYARATPIEDPTVAKYRSLDARLHESPFDPTVPYFLDDDDTEHEITPRNTELRSTR